MPLASSRSAVGTVCGFDHGAVDACRAPAPRGTGLGLHDYAHTRLCAPFALATFDYTAPLDAAALAQVHRSPTVELPVGAHYDGVAIWVEYDLTPRRVGGGTDDDSTSTMHSSRASICESTGPAADGSPTHWVQEVFMLPQGRQTTTAERRWLSPWLRIVPVVSVGQQGSAVRFEFGGWRGINTK